MFELLGFKDSDGHSLFHTAVTLGLSNQIYRTSRPNSFTLRWKIVLVNFN